MTLAFVGSAGYQGSDPIITLLAMREDVFNEQMGLALEEESEKFLDEVCCGGGEECACANGAPLWSTHPYLENVDSVLDGFSESDKENYLAELSDEGFVFVSHT